MVETAPIMTRLSGEGLTDPEAPSVHPVVAQSLPHIISPPFLLPRLFRYCCAFVTVSIFYPYICTSTSNKCVPKYTKHLLVNLTSIFCAGLLVSAAEVFCLWPRLCKLLKQRINKNIFLLNVSTSTKIPKNKEKVKHHKSRQNHLRSQIFFFTL